MSNWVTLPDGYSLDLDTIRGITKVNEYKDYCEFELRFAFIDNKFYECRFEYSDYAESKEELIKKVEVLRDKLVQKANQDKEVFKLVNGIDLKKPDSTTVKPSPKAP